MSDAEDQEDETTWLDDENAEDEKETMVLNPTNVRERIDSALETLSNLKSREKGISRVEIMSTLAKDLSEYYGYIPELCELLIDLFSPAECVEYMDASDRPRPVVIRTNTLKISRKELMEALVKRGVAVEEVEWSKVAIKVTESSVPIGATPEYLSGCYMLQSAASMNPVMALDPQPGERVLDMSSAPGGKTSYIAQLMKNSGTVVANDLKPQRQKATVANLHRMGVKNSIVCCYDGRKIPQVMKGFDRVLLDAPCSGLGVIAKDQTVKLQRTVKDVQRMAHLQKELLCAAVDATDPKSASGGIIVYSTCSVSIDENEQVIQYILEKRNVCLVDTGLQVGKPGYTRYKDKRFHPSLALTRRFYPHVHNMDGFYVAKLRKLENGVRTVQDEQQQQNGQGGEEAEDLEDTEENRLASQSLVKKKDKNTQALKQKPATIKVAAPPDSLEDEDISPVQKKAHDNAVKGKETAKPSQKSESCAVLSKAKVETSSSNRKKSAVSTEDEVEESDNKLVIGEEQEDDEGDDDEPTTRPTVTKKRRSLKALRGNVKTQKVVK